MSKFIKTANTFSVHAGDKIDIRDALPIGTYTAMFDMAQGFYLETTPDVKITHKVYGDSEKIADRILNTYNDRDQNTGVLLSGTKGSGKTVLAKMLSEKGIAEGLITIFVNQPHLGEAFNKFISNINQPCLIMMDEFEKVYRLDQQEQMLTLFDGLYPSKKLFVVTCNETARVNQFMLNRPGRFFYHRKYSGLTHDQILEFLQDTLHAKAKIKDVIDLAQTITDCSYDILKSLVEEINRYDEPVMKAIELLNIDVTPKYADYNILEMTGPKGKLYHGKNTGRIQPLGMDAHFSPYGFQTAKALVSYNAGEYGVKGIDAPTFHGDDLVGIDGGQMRFENEDGYSIVIEERRAVDIKGLLIKKGLKVPTALPSVEGNKKAPKRGTDFSLTSS